MAHYYSTDWVSATPAPVKSQHVSWGPALGLTAVIAGLLILAAFLFPAGHGSVEDAVVYVDCGLAGHGSGMMIDAKHGYVLTNRHVVMDMKTHKKYTEPFHLIFNRGTDHAKTVEANIKEACQEWGTDDSLAHDWAVLEIIKGEPPHTTVHFSDSLNLHAGAKVTAWGFPDTAQASERCVQKPGAITEIDQRAPGTPYPWIMHDASLAGGNSGGPLTLQDGTVVGMNTAADMVRSGTAHGNANYSIPTHVLKQVLDKYASNTFH